MGERKGAKREYERRERGGEPHGCSEEERGRTRVALYATSVALTHRRQPSSLQGTPIPPCRGESAQQRSSTSQTRQKMQPREPCETHEVFTAASQQGASLTSTNRALPQCIQDVTRIRSHAGSKSALLASSRYGVCDPNYELNNSNTNVQFNSSDDLPEGAN